MCVLSKSVCGEEYRGKVYALLVSTPGALHVLLVPPLRTSSTSTFGFDLSIFRRTGTWKNSILKRNKKTGAGPFFAGLSAKLFGLISDVCRCVGPWDVSHSYGHKNHRRGYRFGKTRMYSVMRVVENTAVRCYLC